MENYNLFDVITILIILILGLKGIFRGFIKEAFALFGIIGGVFVASRIAGGAEFSTMIFGIAFAGFWTLCYFAGITVSKIVGLSGLGIFDKILGFIFAGGKIFFIISVIIYASSNIDVVRKKLEPKMQNSSMYPLYIYTGSAIMKLEANKVISKIDANATNLTDKANSAANITQKLKEISK